MILYITWKKLGQQEFPNYLNLTVNYQYHGKIGYLPGTSRICPWHDDHWPNLIRNILCVMVNRHRYNQYFRRRNMEMVSVWSYFCPGCRTVYPYLLPDLPTIIALALNLLSSLLLWNQVIIDDHLCPITDIIGHGELLGPLWGRCWKMKLSAPV